MSEGVIRLRGVSVNNLRQIDLDLAHRRLIVVCGVSGSGKTSLALDTIYAEGQRRYIESFSAYTRRFLEQLDKPEAEQIDGIPPAIAVTHSNPSRSNRATVGTTTEVNDYLSLLFGRVGEVICYGCGQPVRHDSPENAADRLSRVSEGTRLMLGFEAEVPRPRAVPDWVADLVEQGYVRAIVGGTHRVDSRQSLAAKLKTGQTVTIAIDRLSAGETSVERLRESLGNGLRSGEPQLCCAGGRRSGRAGDRRPAASAACRSAPSYVARPAGSTIPIPSRSCSISIGRWAPARSARGSATSWRRTWTASCPIRRSRSAPGRSRRGTRPPTPMNWKSCSRWRTDYKLRVDVPFAELTEAERKIIDEGVPERKFGGLAGFFRWLERRKYKMHLRVFLSRWRSYYPCPKCGGARLRPEALAVRIGGKNFADVMRMEIRTQLAFFDGLRARRVAAAGRPAAGGGCAAAAGST